jgi:hypothetical protein
MAAFELPCRKASQVYVTVARPGFLVVHCELELEPKLILLDGLGAHRAWRADSRPTPHAFRPPLGELAGSHRFIRLHAQYVLVAHAVDVSKVSAGTAGRRGMCDGREGRRQPHRFGLEIHEKNFAPLALIAVCC